MAQRARFGWTTGLLVAFAMQQASDAHAQAVLTGQDAMADEIRLAQTAEGDRVVWLSARGSGQGPIGMVLSAPSGTSLDWASPAWFEALELATAPRVFPPQGVTATCEPDASKPAFHVAGQVDAEPPLPALETMVLSDAADVVLWATQAGLDVPTSVADALVSSDAQGVEFVVARFDGAGGRWVLPTLRAATPASDPTFRFSMSAGLGGDRLQTGFVVAGAPSVFDGFELADIDPLDVVFDAASTTTDYRPALLDALLDAPTLVHVEAASHASWAQTTSIARGTASIPSVVETYFERAAAYGAGLRDPALCIAATAVAFQQMAPVASACPRADLGVIGGDPLDCVESVEPGQVDPAVFRCGPGADDLALAASGAVPAELVLTRALTAVEEGQAGIDASVVAARGEITPVFEAGVVDLSSCEEGEGTGGGANGPAGNGSSGSGAAGPVPATSLGAGGAPGSYVDVPVYGYDAASCGCDGTYVLVDQQAYYDDPETESEPPEAYYQEEEDCDSGATETYSDTEYDESEDCGGGEPVESGGEDDCGGDSTSSADTASDDGGCSSSEGSDSYDDDGGCGSSDGSDDGGCGSDSGSDSDSCSGDSETGAETQALSRAEPAKKRRPRRPRLSVMTMGALLFLTPLRRLLRRRKTAGTASREGLQGVKDVAEKAR